MEVNDLKANININITMDPKTISDLLCCAFEGGSNYWYEITGYEFREGVSYADFKEGGQFTDPDCYYHPCQIIPLHEGCSVLISDEDQVTKLNRDNLVRGLEVLANKYPHHYKNIGSDEEDADTGDAYLQCCLFGDIIYG